MAAYLMIENPGVADPSAFTLLGASTSRKSDNAATIGRFGSGNKNGVAVCLRASAAPIVFAGTLRMTFGTTPRIVDTGRGTQEFSQVQVVYGGKDRDGVSRSGTETLSMVVEYGAEDWGSIDLALREFVSNAIDRAVLEGEMRYRDGWAEVHGASPHTQADFTSDLREYRKTARDFADVKVEIVDEKRVRALAGVTRVFVPLSAAVTEFYNNLGRWFLHFSEPESLKETVLPKKNRNIGNRTAAVIYRRGVRVREFESSDTPSLFDYNLDNLAMDEARKADDWHIHHAAGVALRDAGKDRLITLFQSFTGKPMWEHGFDSYALAAPGYEPAPALAARETRWKEAFEATLGDAVLATAEGGEHAKRKGHRIVTAPEAFVSAATRMGLRTPERVLSQDDRDGRTIVLATQPALEALDYTWELLASVGMLNGRERPALREFSAVMSGGSQTLGFYREGTVYLNSDIVGSLNPQLLVTTLEECVHHVTGAADGSRDLQDYAFNLAIKLAAKRSL